MSGSSRRRFLGQLLGGTAAAVALPTALAADDGRSRWGALLREARSLTDDDPGDESFWRLVKEQFPLRDGLILMNAANLCPSPYPVQEAVFRFTRDVDADASFQNRAKFDEFRESARQALADYVGAGVDEVAITRNTSEGNNTVINGLDLGRGDEVVIWDQNHPTANVAWDVRAERYGYRVVRVTTPPAPGSADELIEPFTDAITSNTRVLAFSHFSNISGVTLPAKRLCAMARARGIITLVDGAQSFGAVRLDLHEMGCDFFTASAHKWFVGPKEAGLLYVRRERAADLWPSDVGVGWEGAKGAGARKFETLGQRDDAAVVSMGTTVAFHESVGVDRIERRVRQLTATLKDSLQDRVPGVRFHTPLDPELSAGVVVFDPFVADVPEAFGRLYTEHGVAGAPRGGDFRGIRLCPHIYNTLQEVERAAEAVASLE
ncbi:MAG: aminotransferase class V-fold PLP-dependent enzyme [Gemmatimonadetes bacterium]|nr:aminotransferase class V-fold PLP-dependent enzyme [Gemmatimonadota bacterium]NIO30944.1 aminotransferase class V-fold PLP-dependent enzyme [Gemmatimonadota bacterium]